MDNHQLIDFLYRRVCLDQSPNEEEERLVQLWAHQSSANRHVIEHLGSRHLHPVSFNNRPQWGLIVLCCLVSIFLGFAGTQLWGQSQQPANTHPYTVPVFDTPKQIADTTPALQKVDMQGGATQHAMAVTDTSKGKMDTFPMLVPQQAHPYAFNLPDSTWRRIDTTALKYGLKAESFHLGLLTLRSIDETVDLNVAPISVMGRFDSASSHLYKDLVKAPGSFLGMVLAAIRIRHVHYEVPETGNEDYFGTYQYSLLWLRNPVSRH